MRLSRDEVGVHLALGFDRVEALREALTAAGIAFDEEPPEGCSGPVYAVLRFEDDVDAAAVERVLDAAGSP